ncbi:MAG: NmrA family NAD(P)-binding protein [Rhizobacter sp.]|nr:NmrA family NAD(P)-binding protein [Chlorobiales bacterium]
MYVITGATGNTGKRIAEALLSKGEPVTVVSRSADKVKDLVAKGAKAAIGDLEDAAFLTKTFTGATAVYAMIPPNFAVTDFRAYQNRVGKSLAEAIEKSGVKYVVFLSSIGAHTPESGVVAGAYDFEKMLKKIDGINVLNLRAGFFMQNFFGNVGLIKQAGINGGFPINGDIKLAMVHTDDIAGVAVKHLLALDFKEQSHIYVAGERDLTLAEATKVLGEAIGKPELPWVTFGYEQAADGMSKMGMPQTVVDGYVQFSKSVNGGVYGSDYTRKPEYTTPTSIESFAKEFAGAYQNS